jgi:hypothetical protein
LFSYEDAPDSAKAVDSSVFVSAEM